VSTDPRHHELPRGPQAIEELRQRNRELRLLLNIALVLVLLLGVAVNILVGKQWRMARSRIAETRPNVQRLAVDFAKMEPSMRSFVSALQSYAFTNAEFQPILSKYSKALPQYFVTPARAPSLPAGATTIPLTAPAPPDGR
jgi:hypothetical protein